MPDISLDDLIKQDKAKHKTNLVPKVFYLSI